LIFHAVDDDDDDDDPLLTPLLPPLLLMMPILVAIDRPGRKAALLLPTYRRIVGMRTDDAIILSYSF